MRPHARGIIKVVMHAHSRPPCLPSVARSLARSLAPISLAAGGACVTLRQGLSASFSACAQTQSTRMAPSACHTAGGGARA